MRVTICGRFRPDEGAVAGYGNRIRVKYTAKWGVQIAGMIFQTGSSSSKVYFLLCTMSDKSRSGFFPFNRIFQKIPSSYADTVPDLHRHCTDAGLPV